MANVLFLSVLMLFVVVVLSFHDGSNNVAHAITNDASSFVPPTVGCNRRPDGFSKTPGDNGFKVSIVSNPERYVPEQTYRVKLQGFKTFTSVNKFTQFSIVVEPSPQKRNEPAIHADVGKFQLNDEVLVKFSDECPNMVMQSSIVPKSVVEVQWKAPSPGSGCIDFKATLLESGNKWYMDDGDLTKQLCEEIKENPEDQPPILNECHACDEAKYELTFQGLWSSHTHPKGFPKNKHETHFSDIVGASHSPEFTMWEYGGIASDGLKDVAEYGMPREIESEMKDQSQNIKTIIKARGLWFPNLNGSTTAQFRVDQTHHLVSLATMLGPSPDWITGVSRMELCQPDGTWVAQRILNLYPWDAGTDAGLAYNSLNEPNVEREPIRRITASFPNNPESPFYDPSGQPMKPVAKLTLKRQRVYEKACGASSSSSEFDSLLEPDLEPSGRIAEDDRMECAVTEWGPYSECSVTCGKGLKARHRHYLMPTKADMFQCSTQLKQMDMCVGSVTHCNGKPEDPIKCATSSWTEWSKCEAECGSGFRRRTRKFLNRKAFKTCQVTTTQTQACKTDVECLAENIIDPKCQVTEWSEWSPCMVTCGKGMQIRTRLFLHAKSKSMCSLELMEKRPCMAAKTDCNFSLQEAMEICNQPRVEGPCRGYFSRWYFDTTKRVCMQFAYSGCRGNQNNFQTAEECNQVCAIMKGSDTINLINPNSVILTYAMRDSSVHVDTQHGLMCVPIDMSQQNAQAFQKLQPMRKDRNDDAVDCMLTPWNKWSECSEKCGGGLKTRNRSIKVYPKNGGKACRGRLEQRKSCNQKPCRK